MKRRIAISIVLLIAAVVAYEQFKNNVVDWYFNNYVTRTTSTPASVEPDQLALTWSGDPRSTQAFQWRTSTDVMDGVVQYRGVDRADEPPTELVAKPVVIEDDLLENDPKNHRFSAVADELSPGTAYTYRVGSPTRDAWSEWHEFTTAPAAVSPFSFLYLGDAQIGLEDFGMLINKAYADHPESAFCIVAGDLVNSGRYRNEWDAFFHGACDVFSTRPIVPVLGNHDYDKQDAAAQYLQMFTLSENGPEGFPPECAYSFTYSNTLFVVLDTNRPLDLQTPWLESTLASSEATWKIAVYHHPAYASAPDRDNREIREVWGALFDQYHVDLALQGHDHAYLRTFPMKGGRPVESFTDGTVYIVSVSGTKYYEQDPHDYAEIQFADVSTYQVIDIATEPDTLTYRAFDVDGKQVDAFTIEK